MGTCPVERTSRKNELRAEREGIGIQWRGISEVRVLTCANGQMAGLKILCLDVCVKGHQESNLKPRSEDRSFTNVPARARQLYYR
jgi:hypothetical protein